MSGPFIIVSVLVRPPFFVKVLWQKSGNIISTSAKIKSIAHFEGCSEARVKTLKTLLLLVLFFWECFKAFFKKTEPEAAWNEITEAAHGVPQVGLLGGSATPESGLCVDPQQQIILVGRHASCSVGAVSIPPQGICH